MTDLARVKFLLQGWDGAPGVNVLHFSPGNADWEDQGDVDEFYDTLNTLTGTFCNTLVGSVSVQADPELTIFDSSTGNITNVVSPTDTPPVGVSNAGGSKTSRATMLLMQYRTGKWVDGRAVKGRSFIGPIHSDNIGTDGKITSSTINAYEGWWEDLFTGLGPRLCVWRRPTTLAPSGGIYEDVTSVSVRSTPSYLSSRLY